jgi:hypothetical protein
VYEESDRIDRARDGRSLVGFHDYGRTISHVICPQNTKGTKTLKLDPTMYDSLSKKVTGEMLFILKAIREPSSAWTIGFVRDGI